MRALFWSFVLGLVLLTGTADAAVVNFSYTGAAQSFVVPTGVTSISIETYGAQGWDDAFGNLGGRGGYAAGDLSVTPGETLWIYVGGRGTGAIGNNVPMGGGFNGGGNGMNNTSIDYFAGGGGGASDVRQGGITLFDRVLVAGGGGGSTTNSSDGGHGGGLIGFDGESTFGITYPAGTGGTQVAGGSNGGAFGVGGSAIAGINTPWNGGGGGGWYGGGTSLAHTAGGGGSSYIGGVLNGSTLAGLQSGDGFVQFTFEVADVPEPSALVLLSAGFFGAIVFRRRRRRS